MQPAFDQFCENLARARSLGGLAQSLSNLTTAAVDLSDILRASLVLAVSAFDHFVHEFVRLGMLEVHRGNRPTGFRDRRNATGAGFSALLQRR